MSINDDNILAFAGILQAATLVKQLAWQGKIPVQELETCIYSLFQVDAPNTAAVYGGKEKLSLGIDSFDKIFKLNNGKPDPEISRYVLSLIHLEKQLSKRSDMLSLIKQGIKRAEHQIQHFPLTHENVIANLASVYTDTLSTFKFRIHITGESNLLANANNLNKIRALLLAGIRSVVLWRQLGGSRLHLVFNRKAMLKQATRIALTIKESNKELALEHE